MASIGRKWALSATALVIVFSGSGRADDRISNALPSSDLQSKVAYCKTCHGLSGQGYRGYYPLPRLAGQQTEYLEQQLQDFAEERRSNPIMFNVARVLNPSMRPELAVHFRDLNPKRVRGAPRELMPMGKQFTRKGFQMPGSLHALLVTVPMLKATGPILVWRVSSTITLWSGSRIGGRNGRQILSVQIPPPSWNRLRKA